PKARLDVGRIPEFLQAYGKKISMQPGKCPTFSYMISETGDALKTVKECISVLKTMKRILTDGGNYENT
ncbi:MAG: hypothetical protein J6P36_06250, partial [Lachnospiraceae bacterium]|nr:hypothetical protein [Lachnospiraceae bacterium]